MPAESFRELAAVVGLYLLDGKWQSLLDLVYKVGGALDAVMVVDPQYPVARTVVNSRKLVVALTGKARLVNELYIDLYPFARVRLA